MTELNTPVAPSSEQPAVPVAESSQQGQVAESSPAPAAESKPETPAIDIDALRKQVAEEAAGKARHDTESEWGKKLSESRRHVSREGAPGTRATSYKPLRLCAGHAVGGAARAAHGEAEAAGTGRGSRAGQGPIGSVRAVASIRRDGEEGDHPC